MDKDDIKRITHDLAEKAITQADAEAWHRGELTDTTRMIARWCKVHDLQIQVWGSPNGPEPMTVIIK